MILLAASACGVSSVAVASGPVLRIGVMLPLSGVDAQPAQGELRGIQIAVDAINSEGGVRSRRVQLVVRDLHAIDAAPRVAQDLKAAGVSAVLGTYASYLSIPASRAVSDRGLVYWETGAVADQVTGPKRPLVFRVGASGAQLGRNSSVFAAEELAPRLGVDVSRMRLAVVEEDDAYGASVADGVVAEAVHRKMLVVTRVRYRAGAPNWDAVFGQLALAGTDVVMLSSYIEDGVAFRREMLRRQLKVGALIGTTMAECGPDFGADLGADAIGVFASDRPTQGFNPGALTRPGRHAFEQLRTRYVRRYGADPAEEAISGFSSAWSLLRYVLPKASGQASAAIAAAARAEVVPVGDLPNGAGLQFGVGDQAGQNLRAASVVWQWQGVRKSVTVWPPAYANGRIRLVPLPR
jgi:branched-chain amino acid transport system substrate-binding protein